MESDHKTPYNQAAKAIGRSEGNQRGEGGWSITLLGKRAIRRGEMGWMLTMTFHGVEISIAGGGEEIVSAPNLLPFFLFFSLFFLIIF